MLGPSHRLGALIFSLCVEMDYLFADGDSTFSSPDLIFASRSLTSFFRSAGTFESKSWNGERDTAVGDGSDVRICRELIVSITDLMVSLTEAPMPF